MSERGTFIVDRGLFTHPVFKDEPFTEREAWLWLIGQAAFKPHEVRRGHNRIKLDRGQLAHATRFMAEAWKWSASSVRRFLATLLTERMIVISSRDGADLTQITICNYDEWQRDPENSGAEVAQPRRKEEEKEVSKKEVVRDARATPSLISPEAHRLADECRAAVEAPVDDFYGLEHHAQAWLSEGHSPPLLVAAFMDAVRRYGRAKPMSYYQKAVMGALENRAPPVPRQREMPLLQAVNGGPREAATRDNRQPWQVRRDQQHAAVAELSAGLDAIERASGRGG